MNSIFNRIVLILGLSAFILSTNEPQNAIVPIVTAIALSGFLEYFNSANLNLAAVFGYTILSLLFPQFIYFLPISFYDVLLTKYQPVAFIAIIPIAANLDSLSPVQILSLVMIIGIEVILKQRANKNTELRIKYIAQRDDFTEHSRELQKKIIDLTERQDSEVNLATLNERNRIAREIHDTVGHLLSSSILQIGALMAITKEEFTKNGLETVKNTLDSGMDSIRNSVHNLHEDSVDLKAQLTKLTDEFTFCSITLNYEIHSDLPVTLKYAVISIVKEALVNVIKHSNATEVSISFFEHPMLLQLIVTDNGTHLKSTAGGMGLESIRQRINSFGGIININYSKGFKIFISIPKGTQEPA